MIPTNERMMRDAYLDKPLPANNDAERTILGGIILDNALISQTIEKSLTFEDFYSPNHRTIFKAMVSLFERGENIDPIMISEELKKDDVSVESLGGIVGITNLTYGLPTFSEIYDYVKIVKEKSIARNLIKNCSQIISQSLSEETDIYDVISQAGQSVFSLLDSSDKKGFRSIGELADISFTEVQHRAKKAIDSPYTLRGLSTGFKDLNEKTSGIVKPNLFIIAGRPSSGKTALALNIAENAVEDDTEAVVGVFSLEMSAELLGSRMVASRAKVDSHRYANAYMSRDEWERVAQAKNELKDKKIFIEDSPKQKVIELQVQAQRLKHDKKRLDLLIIDYLQLVKGNGKNQEQRHLELSDIMKDFAAMRKILDCPIILLSQLSRAVEKRNPPRPLMSDLRESGAIEETADVILMIYREEYYKPTEVNKGVAEIIVGKNRNGPTGTVKLAFLSEFVRFENFYQDY